jgi:hypothetical protein
MSACVRIPDEDASINQDVVETLALDPRLSGRIGVETRDRMVLEHGSLLTME